MTSAEEESDFDFLDEIELLSQFFTHEAEKLADFLSRIIDSLKRPDAIADSDGDQEDRIITDHCLSLDEDFQEVSSLVAVSPSPFAAEVVLNSADDNLTSIEFLGDTFNKPDGIDLSLHQFSQESDGNVEVNADGDILEEGKKKLIQNEISELEGKAEDKLDENEQKTPRSDAEMIFPSPVAAESILNLNSQADTGLTNSGNICSMNQEVCSGATVKAREDIPSPVARPEPLESSFDEPDERDSSFEQKFREEKEKFAKELAEKRLKREEKQEPLSRLFTQVTYNYINHTNKSVCGSKIRATDLKKFSDDEWSTYFQEHIENFKLICTDFFKDGFVLVDMKKGKTKKEFIDALKKFLLEFFSDESEKNEEVVVSNPADSGLTNPGCSKDASVEPDEIDQIFEEVPQEPEESKEVAADKKITEEGKALIQEELDQMEVLWRAEGKTQKKIEQKSTKPDQFGELRKTENEKELTISDTGMDYQTCQMSSEENCELEPEPEGDTSLALETFNLHLEDPKQSIEAEMFTNFLSDMLGSLKRPDALPDSDGVQEERIVDDYIRSMDEGFQEVSSSATDLSSPSPTEFFMNPSDNEATKLGPLEDSVDDPDEVDPSFEQKMREQNEAFMEKMAEKKRKREEKQKKFQEELNEVRKQQKLCFAALLTCIQLKHRFEEKEQDVASWIKNCCKEPVLRLLRGFEDFRDTAREWKYFKKIPEDSVTDARSEIEGLHGKVYFLLNTLRTSFDQLEQLSGMAPDALFLRVLQKSICDLAGILNDILDILEENQTDNCWYQILEESFSRISPEKIPTTTMLKWICQKGSGVEYENLKFPERIVTSSVVIVQDNEKDDITEQRQEQESMESDNSFTDHLSTQNSVHKCFQEDQKTEEFDSFPTDNLEHQTKGTSTPQSNRKRSSDPAFFHSFLAMTPTNDFQKELLNSRTEKKSKHFYMNLVN
ncbi:hypothetical protein CAEBREN_09248 [Caenorhabditis brenneri]|uniref:Uncharacterized protein n=1 Tax=Caenorhabditis brenneri TaxID=135651 RepID=G0MA71_CAEBE|nr:hypothetical protein CAEBREN_09248 [Caenorhabditis brenneri]